MQQKLCCYAHKYHAKVGVWRMEMNVFASFFNYLNLWTKAIDEARISYRTYDALSNLSDKDLAHLGMSRQDIPRVAFRIEERTQ